MSKNKDFDLGKPAASRGNTLVECFKMIILFYSILLLHLSIWQSFLRFGQIGAKNTSQPSCKQVKQVYLNIYSLMLK